MNFDESWDDGLRRRVHYGSGMERIAMRLDAADAPAVDDDVDVLPDGIGLTQDRVDHFLAGPQIQADHFGTNRDPLAGNGQFFDKPRGS